MKFYVKVLLIILFLASPMIALAQQDNNDEAIVVGVSHYYPFVKIYVKDGEVAFVAGGYSVEYWNEAAEKMGISNVSYKILSSVEEKITCLERKECDVAIGGISVAGDREERVDFSHPTFEAGLGSMMGENDNILPSFSKRTIKTFKTFLIFLLFSASVIFFLERRRGGVLHGLGIWLAMFDSIWFIEVTGSTVGYGGVIPKTFLGRQFTAIFIIPIGLSLCGLSIGQISSDLSADNVKFNISSYSDLKELRVGTKVGFSSDTLVEAGIRPKVFPTIEAAYKSLKDDDIDVVIYDLPGLLSYIKDNPDSGLVVSNKVFHKHNYAFAFPEGSELREKVNRIIVKNPEIKESLYNKYF
ncbi:transporter substrate-binding domain-containing protein [Patescibacteria group bacterium]